MVNYPNVTHDETCILVQMDQGQAYYDLLLSEFMDLARSANLKIIQTIGGQLAKPKPNTFVAKGKADEIAHAVQFHTVQVVLFNHELTPAQGRNLEKLFQCRVLDRTELILDIFAKRAQSYEGKLQVELAQLQHLRTRLIRGWTHLERQKGGIGLRGPGETQLETDRRLIGIRIKSIKQRLQKVSNQRQQQRRARKKRSLPTVSLVGYTNAGKSTLFNHLTAAHVYVADQLFATLDPTLRQLDIKHLGKIILADTVGFIRDLPHDLVAAFRATLEETYLADLLLHVVDAADPTAAQMIDSVNSVLQEIQADHITQLLVCNKIDLTSQFEPRIDYAKDGKPWRVWISAATEQGITLLKQAIFELLSNQVIHTTIELTPEQYKLRAKLYQLQAVESEQLNEQGHYLLTIKLSKTDYDKIIK